MMDRPPYEYQSGEELTWFESWKPRNFWQETWWWIRHGLWNYVRDFPREVYWFCQRGMRGYSDRDTWGLDYHLARIIAEGTAQIKKYKSGHPADITEKQWDIILNEIIWTFEMATEILDNSVYYMKYVDWNKDDYERFNKTCEELKQKCPDGKFYAMTKEECKRYEDGWKLFQEYFFSLWD